MKVIMVILNLLFVALLVGFAYGASSDRSKAESMEKAVAGGYEALLAYEGRDNSDTFNSPEDYVAEKSRHYSGQAGKLRQRSKMSSLCAGAAFLTLLAIDIRILISNKTA